MWEYLAVWRKVSYALGAVIIAFAIGSGLAVIIHFAQVPVRVAGAVGLLVALLGSFRIYRYMREDYEYVRSTEYRRRNPHFARDF